MEAPAQTEVVASLFSSGTRLPANLTIESEGVEAADVLVRVPGGLTADSAEAVKAVITAILEKKGAAHVAAHLFEDPKSLNAASSSLSTETSATDVAFMVAGSSLKNSSISFPKHLEIEQSS